ncbi:MAG: DUF1801 domain-containing protein [Kangiellaceae bacterium]|nr:DUF1801 domain-containing protein [Kangiellaceae bacterium]MCW8998417.1 DUF1801 domain-containing protein [Kangiellaceae bacterium]MCW9018132.1 DUF1801 domain-containing protein [Kangiellaceae bacterium]
MDETSRVKINQLLEDIQYQSPQKYELFQFLRNLIKSQNSDLSEQVKYGGLVFSCGGVLRCGVFVYKNHLSLEFGAGAEFPDPDKLLEGKGKFRRHLKLTEIVDVEGKKVEYFVKLATR